jgi:hypothetical protein
MKLPAVDGVREKALLFQAGHHRSDRLLRQLGLLEQGVVHGRPRWRISASKPRA